METWKSLQRATQKIIIRAKAKALTSLIPISSPDCPEQNLQMSPFYTSTPWAHPASFVPCPKGGVCSSPGKMMHYGRNGETRCCYAENVTTGTRRQEVIYWALLSQNSRWHLHFDLGVWIVIWGCRGATGVTRKAKILVKHCEFQGLRSRTWRRMFW